MTALSKWLVITQLLLTTTVAIHLTCDTVNPLVQSDITCICNRTSGNGIEWYLDDVSHSFCSLSLVCAPQHSGYKYSINKADNVFELTFEGYSYSNCTKVSCKNLSDKSIEQTTVPSSIIFDSTYPTNLTEPTSNHQNGRISATTGCISGFSDIQFAWYIIHADSSKKEEKYFPQQTFDTSDTSTCISCSNVINGNRTIGFEHTESSGSGTKEVYFRLVLSHSSTTLHLNLTSNYVYTVKGENESSVTNASILYTTSSSFVNNTATTTDMNGTFSRISTISVIRNTTLTTNVTKVDTKITNHYLLYIGLPVLLCVVVMIVVILIYVLCLRRNKNDTNRNESHQHHQQNFTNISEVRLERFWPSKWLDILSFIISNEKK